MSEDRLRETWEVFKGYANSALVLQHVHGGDTNPMADAGTQHEEDFFGLLERIRELEAEIERLKENRAAIE